MAYVPFTNDYSSQRTPAYIAAELARRTAKQSRVNDIITEGNQVMGNLIATCCSDPAYAGQGFYDPNSPGDGSTAYLFNPAINPGSAAASPGGPGYNPMSVLPVPGVDYRLTPVDILTGTYGFPMRRGPGIGLPWPRPRIPDAWRQRWADTYPDISGTMEARQLIPNCGCATIPPPLEVPPPPVSGPMHEAHYRAAPGVQVGMGQVDTTNPLSGVGGLLAVVAAAGILLWASKK